MKKRFVRWIILLAIGLGIGSAIVYVQKQSALDNGVTALPDQEGAATILKQPAKSDDVSGMNSIGGDFTLINNKGETVTQDDYADTYKLIFFGFTYCPAICPAELQKFALIMDQLGDKADSITPIFISVDPERDTPEVIDTYIAQFHPKLVGLTGTQEQIDAVKSAFKVYSSKVENEMMSDYMVDHSSFTYLTDKDNKVITMYPAKDTAEKIAQDILDKNL